MPVSDLSWRAALLATLICAQGCGLQSGEHSAGGAGGVGGSGFSGEGGVGFPRDAGLGFGGFGGGTAGVGGGLFDSGFPQLCPFCPPPPPSPVSAFLSSCCPPTGGCGFFTSGLLGQSCVEPKTGVPDVTCPAGVAPILGGLGIPADLAGCCTSSGMCGVSLDTFGLGCVERSDIGVGTVIDLSGDPRLDIRCGQPDTDAGVDDAGDPLCAWALRNGMCDPVAKCERVSSAAVCECPAGYADLSPNGQRGAVCRDVNECLLGSGVCDAGQCVNTPGGFACESINL